MAAIFEDRGVILVDMRKNEIPHDVAIECIKVFARIGVNRVGMDGGEAIATAYNETIESIKQFGLFNEQCLNDMLAQYYTEDLSAIKFLGDLDQIW